MDGVNLYEVLVILYIEFWVHYIFYKDEKNFEIAKVIFDFFETLCYT